MSVFLTILSVAGAVIGCLLALVIIVFLVLLPIKAEVITGYNKDDGFFLKLRYFAFGFDVYPMKSKKKTKDGKEKKPVTDQNYPPAEETAAEEKTDGKKKPDKPAREHLLARKIKSMGVDDYIALIGFAGDMLKKMRFGDFCLNLVLATDDAAKTATLYGATVGAVFPLIGTIHNNKLAKYIDAHINADFSSESTYADIYIEVYLRTVHAVALALKSLIYIMKIKENDNGK